MKLNLHKKFIESRERSVRKQYKKEGREFPELAMCAVKVMMFAEYEFGSTSQKMKWWKKQLGLSTFDIYWSLGWFIVLIYLAVK